MNFYAIIRSCKFYNCFSALSGLVPINFIHKIEMSNHFVAVPINNLIFVCFFIQICDNSNMYFVDPVNLIESEWYGLLFTGSTTYILDRSKICIKKQRDIKLLMGQLQIDWMDSILCINLMLNYISIIFKSNLGNRTFLINR